jgi:mannose-6-phosphate isomerase-like protein (cupin superfamily)|tara:strand:+ start:1535 stop:1897 length:363 start_codon:yes stop_codon:yes gene_type:complete
MTQLTGKIDKGWGHEEIWATNDKYCGKLMHFTQGAQFSMHLHKEKDETWYVLSGEFTVASIDTSTAAIKNYPLSAGSIWRNKPMEPHQLTCSVAGTIIEVSTPDSVEDNYRVMPGDSQRV